MKEFLNKFIAMEKELAEEKGKFALFGLFLREDVEDRWDLVISAQWLKSNNKQDYEIIAKSLKKFLSKEEVIYLSRIVILDKGNPILEAVNRAFSIEHGQVECKDCNFFGLQIKHAYIITSKRENEIPQAKSA
jgi:hypothetical protein